MTNLKIEDLWREVGVLVKQRDTFAALVAEAEELDDGGFSFDAETGRLFWTSTFVRQGRRDLAAQGRSIERYVRQIEALTRMMTDPGTSPMSPVRRPRQPRAVIRRVVRG